MLLRLLEKALGALAVGATLKAEARRLGLAIAYAAIVALFALAALIFLFVVLDRWLTRRLGDPIAAAAILAGANLVIVALILVVRSLTVRRTPKLPIGAVANALLGQLDVETGMAAGAALGAKLRRSTPSIVLVVALVGLAIGVRPELLNLFRPRRDKPPR